MANKSNSVVTYTSDSELLGLFVLLSLGMKMRWLVAMPLFIDAVTEKTSIMFNEISSMEELPIATMDMNLEGNSTVETYQTSL